MLLMTWNAWPWRWTGWTADVDQSRPRRRLCELTVSVGTTVDTKFNNLILSKDDGMLLFLKVSGQAGPRKYLEQGGDGRGLVADIVDKPGDCVVVILVLAKLKVDDVVGWARATWSASAAELM